MGGDTMPSHNKRLAQSRPEGGFALRVYHHEGSGKKMPRFLVKCGCCDQQVEIYYSPEDLEINGVLGSLKNWRELLLPLLKLGPSREQSSTLRARRRRSVAPKR